MEWTSSTNRRMLNGIALASLLTVGALAPAIANTAAEEAVTPPETSAAPAYFYPPAGCINMPDLVPGINKVRYKGKLNKKAGMWIYKVQAKVEVTNLGTACAMEKSSVRLFLSADPFLDASDIYVGDKKLKKLCPAKKPGKFPRPKKLSVKATLPPGVNPYGMYLLAVADADNVISECNEDNNLALALY